MSCFCDMVGSKEVACRKSGPVMLNVSKRKGGTGLTAFLGDFVHICMLVHSVLQVCMVRGWIRIAYCLLLRWFYATRRFIT
jgi:hypothetical protein